MEGTHTQPGAEQVAADFQMASLNAAKQQLRSLMKQKLKAVTHDSIVSQSAAVFNTLKTLQPFVEARSISVFLSMPSGEIQTDAIVRHALEIGKEVFVPYLHKNPLPPSSNTPTRVMDMVRLKDLEDYESLKRDAWGIPSIDPATVHARQRVLGGPDAHHSEDKVLDLILMPGVAFDIGPAEGLIRRLGHGKGFYDFFVNQHDQKEAVKRRGRPVLLYGLALSEQFLSSSSGQEVPIGPLDQGLDGLIFGSGEVKIPSAAK